MFIVAIIFTGCCIAWLGFKSMNRKTATSLPPGPPPLPVIGNLFQLPRKNMARVYASWTKVYGDIIYMHVFGRQFILLNSTKAILELLDEQGASYSDRPRLPFAGEMVGREESVLFHQYGERLKKHRKLLRSGLNTRRIPEYWPLMESESWRLMEALITAPQDFIAHLRRHSGAVTLQLAYGYKVKSYLEDDHFVSLAEDLATITTEASEPGRWLVDSFPFLKHVPHWLPGVSFVKWAREARLKSEEFTNAPYEFAVESYAEGRGSRSYTTEIIEYLEAEKGRKLDPMDERLIKWNSASIYAGGTDTTVALIEAFFLYMAVFPEVQTIAQAELDRVIGTDRLPSMEDESQLPYVQALIKELHRFNPIVPLIPHSGSQDEVYRGFHIPKGCWIMANSWAIMHDPLVFQAPHRFWPGRYLPKEGGCLVDPRDYSFGFGRRRCPGLAFANAVIFITVAQTLAVFNVEPDGDVPELAFTSGHVSHPEPFHCKITPRSNAIKDLVAQLAAQTVSENSPSVATVSE
ncbi:cytochrome P450 [Mycena sanguinolenta]|nr:cytochrome P450 [Mycena sanguinolenta]